MNKKIIKLCVASVLSVVTFSALATGPTIVPASNTEVLSKQNTKAITALQQSDKSHVTKVKALSSEISQIRSDLNTMKPRVNENYRYVTNIWRALGGEYNKSTVEQDIKSVNELAQKLSIQATELDIALKRIADKSVELDKKSKLLDELIKSVDAKSMSGLSNLHKVTEVQSTQAQKDKKVFYYLLIALSLFVTLLIGFVAGRTRKRSTTLAEQLSETKNAQMKLEEASVELDVKLANYLNNQMHFEQAKVVNTQETEVDHTFMLNVADEVTRMQKNIHRLTEKKVKGTKPLLKGIERMKASLEESGYEMVELLGQSYDERKNMEVVNIHDDDSLENGQKLITKVMRPQVNYNGKLIQRAQVDISVNL
ncbi:hypothetical protein [Vibrio rarus]|uniref:hypothetical protein n=1 Tax=Vibrio rarus TaxID=413403 RepID=UPI0021C36F64|nr:hypothetical protein [Vibrio rarus]